MHGVLVKDGNRNFTKLHGVILLQCMHSLPVVHKLSSCATGAYLLLGMWDLSSQSGPELASPATIREVPDIGS